MIFIYCQSLNTPPQTHSVFSLIELFFNDCLTNSLNIIIVGTASLIITVLYYYHTVSFDGTNSKAERRDFVITPAPERTQVSLLK